MKQYKTAQGKIVDMAALAAKNERTRAVGNMKVNGRGDTIDSNGKIILPVTQKVAERYQNTVGNKSAIPTKQKNINKKEMTSDEIELETFMDDDVEVENIKTKENKK